MIIATIIIIYLIIAFIFFKKFKWNHPKWEQIMLSLSWPCIGIVYAIKEILRPNC